MRGDGRVFQRGQIWWVAYYHDGREHRESSKSRERKDAVRLLRTRIGEIAAGTAQHAPVSSRAGTRAITMQDLFDLVENHYQTQQSFQRNQQLVFTAPAPPFRGMHRPGLHEPGHQPLHDRHAAGGAQGANHQP